MLLNANFVYTYYLKGFTIVVACVRGPAHFSTCGFCGLSLQIVHFLHSFTNEGSNGKNGVKQNRM